jgi:YgiT-type zinc finger domain-containing protein
MLERFISWPEAISLERSGLFHLGEATMDYRKCPCGGTYQERWVEVRMTVTSGEKVTLTDVPQGACPVCGSRVYKAQILDGIETLWHDQRSGPD